MASRIPFDSLTMRAVADELRTALDGGQIQHVSLPAPTDLVLTVRARGANHFLTLSCDAAWARVHLSAAKRANPPTPPAFCMLCRKYIDGGRIIAVSQRGFDRVLDIEVDGAEGRAYRLVAEVMGKHSNLLLLSEDGVILDAAKHITRRLSRYRETLPGRAYVPPPAQEGENPLDVRAEDLDELAAALERAHGDREAQCARWMARFAGISPFLAEELVRRSEGGGVRCAWEEVFGAAREGRWSPVIVRDERAQTVGAYPIRTLQWPPERQFGRDSVNTALDHYYGTAIPRAALDARRTDPETFLDRAIRAREKQIESVRRSLSESGRADEYRTAGELILANLHAIAPEAECVQVVDYYRTDAPERTIALDPAKSARENADSYFRRYRKARDGAAIQQEQLARTESALSALRAARARAAALESAEAAKGLRAELLREGLLRPEGGDGGGSGKERPHFEGRKIRTYTTPEGYEIFVGENSEANDYLTGRVARPNDLWLHVRAAACAHVVIRTGGDPQRVPRAVLEEAARLCARHSPSRHAGLVPVDYTLRKYVRRPRGSASGAALYQNEKTLHVDPSR